MTTELIDVIDTAVKIGLGALISGISTYAVTHLNHKKDKNKLLFERHLERVERATENVEEYFEAWGALLRRAGAMARRLEEKGKELSDLTESQKKSLMELDKAFVKSWEKKNSAITTFRLLGMDEIVKSIKDAQDLHGELREIIVFDKAVPSYSGFKDMRKKFNIYREQFHMSARKRYKQLTS